MGWPSVQAYQDGEDVVASVLNKPIGQLAERTDYLRRLLDMNDRTKVVVSATVTAPPGTSGVGAPVVGQPVYRIPDSGSYATAAAIVSENAWFYADEKAMAVGIVGSTDGVDSAKADIILYGFKDFGDEGISASTVIADENPVSGRYYLSPSYGKLTANPGGPVIYVCDCRIAYSETKKEYRVLSMLVNPQYRDTGESHIHRSFVVSGNPMGGYALKLGGVYTVTFIWPKNDYPTTAMKWPIAGICAAGYWNTDKEITYKLEVRRKTTGSLPADEDDWSGYELHWTATGDSSGGDTEGVSSLSFTSAQFSAYTQVGSHGLRVQLRLRSSSTKPTDLKDKVWELKMPDAARSWIHYATVDGVAEYRLNLGMYPEMSRFVPPVPLNGASLTLDEAEPRGIIFGDRKQWEIKGVDPFSGGPWLVWYGGQIEGVSATAPFKWVSDTEPAEPRDISLHVNRMRVGPTGFVTSLQAAEGSPLRITSALTGADAIQGALQIALDVDFKTSDGNVQGSNVVKRITGSTFETGPVVERIVAGPGLSVFPAVGQGVVTISATNAVYSGDFETIALKNAKQDLAGQVFPYTKLMKWPSPSSGNVASGFTAKFRVPDHIRYREGGYRVIVSASVFGEEDADASTASFALKNYVLADYACSLTMPKSGLPEHIGRFSSPQEGVSAVIPVGFADGYKAFDPILVHGFPTDDVPDLTQRQHRDGMLLKYVESGVTKDVIVYPGYFVGISIDRCDVTGDGDWYTAPLGIMSLRWNLVEA